jgi:hypothetical protein
VKYKENNIGTVVEKDYYKNIWQENLLKLFLLILKILFFILPGGGG